jgi:hypothetical protein
MRRCNLLYKAWAVRGLVCSVYIKEVLKLWAPSRGAVGPLWRGLVDYMRDIFILSEIWVQDKIFF